MSTMTLAEALRVTAKRIREKPGDYKWVQNHQCNCGILFQTISGMNEAQTKNLIYSSLGFIGIWKDQIRFVHSTCPVADVPLGSVVRILRDFGISMRQIAQLEVLSNPQIRCRAGLPIVAMDYCNPPAVIAYMEAWASLLDEQVNDSLDDAGKSVAVAV